MHELAITCGIVELVAEAAKGRNRSEAAGPRNLRLISTPSSCRTPYGQIFRTAEEPVLDRAIEGAEFGRKVARSRYQTLEPQFLIEALVPPLISVPISGSVAQSSKRAIPGRHVELQRGKRDACSTTGHCRLEFANRRCPSHYRIN